MPFYGGLSSPAGNSSVIGGKLKQDCWGEKNCKMACYADSTVGVEQILPHELELMYIAGS